MNYNTLASKDVIESTMAALTERGHVPELVATRADALARIQQIIPAGASVMNGSSRTLEQIGFVDYLKAGTHDWDNVHEAILAETDPVKKSTLRKRAVLADYYLGSAHAIAQTGEIIVASNSGSQLPHLVFTSQNLILVVGTQKITPDEASAQARLREYVLPLEDARMKEVGMGGSFIAKVLTIYKEQPFMGRTSHIIFVNEELGF